MNTKVLLPFCLACTAWVHAVNAQRIDFESLPDGSIPADRMAISNQFAGPPFGVTFQYEDGKYPEIAKVGGQLTAFRRNEGATLHDTPKAGQDAGSYFLTDGPGTGGTVGRSLTGLIITYSQPVAAASGFILDVDHQEAWDIFARNAATQVVAQVHLQHGTAVTGDGIATPWVFRRDSADIHSVRIKYAGNTNDGVGLAFDNFSPATNLPSPVAALLAMQVVSNKVNLEIKGTRSAVYSVEATSSLIGNNWSPVTSVVLPSSSFRLTNLESVTVIQRFYRAVGLQ